MPPDVLLLLSLLRLKTDPCLYFHEQTLIKPETLFIEYCIKLQYLTSIQHVAFPSSHPHTHSHISYY